MRKGFLITASTSRTPDEHYTAGRYAREAAASIEAIRERGRRVVVAGGTGFYIRALIDGLAPPSAP